MFMQWGQSAQLCMFRIYLFLFGHRHALGTEQMHPPRGATRQLGSQAGERCVNRGIMEERGIDVRLVGARAAWAVESKMDV